MSTKRQKKASPKTWRPTVQDQKLMDQLQIKYGVTEVDILRIALRRLAEHEGIIQTAKAAD